jgi:hypothetical protein
VTDRTEKRPNRSRKESRESAQESTNSTVGERETASCSRKREGAGTSEPAAGRE